jgi:hypothetical protein
VIGIRGVESDSPKNWFFLPALDVGHPILILRSICG